eukprot:2212565-Ditylum_brightwellii.AAC.1
MDLTEHNNESVQNKHDDPMAHQNNNDTESTQNNIIITDSDMDNKTRNEDDANATNTPGDGGINPTAGVIDSTTPGVLQEITPL